jgi:hypothetical protein
MRTVPPIVADKRLRHLQRLMQMRKSPSKDPRRSFEALGNDSTGWLTSELRRMFSPNRRIRHHHPFFKLIPVFSLNSDSLPSLFGQGVGVP